MTANEQSALAQQNVMRSSEFAVGYVVGLEVGMKHISEAMSKITNSEPKATIKVDIVTPATAKDNPTELFEVFGKIELRGEKEMNAQFDVLLEKAENLARLLDKIGGVNP